MFNHVMPCSSISPKRYFLYGPPPCMSPIGWTRNPRCDKMDTELQLCPISQPAWRRRRSQLSLRQVKRSSHSREDHVRSHSGRQTLQKGAQIFLFFLGLPDGENVWLSVCVCKKQVICKGACGFVCDDSWRGPTRTLIVGCTTGGTAGTSLTRGSPMEPAGILCPKVSSMQQERHAFQKLSNSLSKKTNLVLIKLNWQS